MWSSLAVQCGAVVYHGQSRMDKVNLERMLQVLFPSFESCNFSLFTWDSIRTECVSHISLTHDIEAANHHSTPNFLQVFQQMLRKKSVFVHFL